VIRYHGDGYLTAGNLRLAILRALFRGEGCPIPPYTNQTIAQDDPAGETHYTWTATSVVPSTIPDAGVAAKTVCCELASHMPTVAYTGLLRPCL